MSKKWQRNRAWENEHLVGPLFPVRVVLRVFSTIPTAVVLLLFVSLYATLASVPIGMIARIPTLLIVAALFIGLLAIPVLPSLYVTRRALAGAGRPTRFLAMFGVVIVLGGLMTALWATSIWPRLEYSWTTGTGFMLFPEFVDKYKSTTLRRLPGFEMTETEFYAWWPMRLALVLFVINMVVTTIRRIEFNFKNLGVLSVHTGIVIIALGSIFYQRFKLEGDTLLPAGTNGMPGPAQNAFYDREDVALWVAQARTRGAQPRFEQRPLLDLPLYNAYGLTAGVPEDSPMLSDLLGRETPTNDEGRTLDQPVPAGPGTLVDPDVSFRVVGFSPYATLDDDWYSAPAPESAPANPHRMVDLHFTRGATPGELAPDGPIFQFPFFLGEPANRIRANEMMAVEFTRGMSDQRWDDLSTDLGSGFEHALVIEIPGQNFRTVIPVRPRNRLTLGNTGWTVEVDQLAPEPPFPIITPGYENATSSVAVVNLIKQGQGGLPEKSFTRWVFHRFPELNQDLTPSSAGRPVRTDPDPAIRVSYLDASKLQIYLDERLDEPVTRAIVRQPTGEVRVFDELEDGWLLDLIPNPQNDRLDLHVSASWPHAERITRPIPVPTKEQDKSLVGSYTEAFVGVEVSVASAGERPAWSKVVWLPFSQFAMMQNDRRRTLRLPDGRNIMLSFGRYQRALPGFEIALVDFEMISYDHRGAPRDYQSVVRVMPNRFYPGKIPDFESYEHVVKLNNPLRAPHHWDPERSWLGNMFVRLRAGMDPDQFKLSQASWDRSGWQQSQEMVDQGLLDEPRANFTVLGVGNNPGIHIIAFGSILMSVGIPWAFYFKPYLVKREKRRLAELHTPGKAHPAKTRPASTNAASPALEEAAT